MRIRIQSYSPLPDIKAWFVPDAHNLPESIANLKDELCRRVQGLKNAQYRGQNLILLLDDFELLDDSPFGAVRDGDLICIKQLSPPEIADAEMRVVPEEPHGQKRKRSHILTESNTLFARQLAPLGLATTSTKTKTRVVKPPPASYETDSDSDSSSSTSSTSSSSSSSSSSTSTSSTSSTSSSSTSSSPPKPLSFKKAITNRSLVSKPTTTTVHVPPGLGKPSTHSRNKRRQKKREYLKSGATPAAPTLKGASEVNSIPLGPTKSRPSATNPAAIPLPPSPPPVKSIAAQASSSTSPARKKARTTTEGTNAGSNDSTPAPVYITQDQVMMSSMRNKNKKKGFKLSMSNPIPQKIVFDEHPPGTATNAPEPSRAVQPESSNEQMQIDARPQPIAVVSASTSSLSLFNPTGPAPNARLVPPSEIQERGELPSNMFVTSVDVEAGMWGDSYSADNNGKSAKAKKRGKKKVSYEEEQYYGDDSYYAKEDSWNNAGDGPAGAVDMLLDYSEGAGEGSTSAGGLDFDWDRTEKQWDSASLITSPDQLTPGIFVGWKALAINPRTFSPEVLLNVARVVEGPDTASGKGVVVRAIHRIANNEAAFAFGLNAAAGDGEAGEEVDEETVEWSDVTGSEWRLLNI